MSRQVHRLSSRSTRYSEAEWQASVELAACFRLLNHFGWDQLVWNHSTVRVPGSENHFLINQLGMHYTEICASNLVKVDIDGNIVEGPDNIPPAGFTIHSAVHRARSDAHASVHCHAMEAVQVACLKDGLEMIASESTMLYDDIAYHGYEGVSLDLGERERIARNLGDKNVLMLRNHGPVTLGKTIGAAFVRMYWLILACRIQMGVMATGERYTVIPREVCDVFASQTEHFEPGLQEWDALMRLMQRKDPSFME